MSMEAAATATVKTIAFQGTVVIDTREQLPYEFATLRTNADQGRQPILVPTVRACLPSGDYSLAGYETEVAIERKSAADLFRTLGQGRARFVAELERLDNACTFAAVVVEAEWSEILTPPAHTKMNPLAVYRSILAWMQRYSRVHWLLMPGRMAAEHTTFRILERYWLDRKKGNNNRKGI